MSPNPNYLDPEESKLLHCIQ